MLARFGSLVLVVALACLVAACGGTTGSTGAPGGPASEPAASSLTLRDAWVRAAPAGGVSAAYLTIANGLAADDVLVGASAPEVTDRASLHETTTGDDGMTGMHHASAIAIPARGSLTLQPGGVHVMLEDLKKDLVAGGTVHLQLAFERAGVVEVDARVRGE
jgi:copper(I)-binding protein